VNVTALRARWHRFRTAAAAAVGHVRGNIEYGPRLAGLRDKAKLDQLVEQSLTQAALWDEVKDRLNESGLRCRAGSSSGCAWRACWHWSLK